MDFVEEIKNKGLDVISEYKQGSLALPRKFEVLAAINRIRGGSWL